MTAKNITKILFKKGQIVFMEKTFTKSLFSFAILISLFSLSIFVFPHPTFALTSTMSKIAIFIGEGGSNPNYSFRHAGKSFYAADINGDGYPDIITSDRHASNGKVYVFFASTSLSDKGAANADIILGQNTGGHLFGSELDAGDINNDGVTEIIAGDYSSSSNAGMAFIFKTGSSFSSRNTSSADATITGAARTYSSTSLGVIGDVNGDGYKDYIYEGGGDGKLYLFYGNQNFTNKSVSQADVVITDDTGTCVNTVGVAFASEADLNNDDFKDIIIGCRYPASNGGKGRNYVFYGNSSLTNKNLSQADVILSPGSSSVYNLGTEVITADLNKDGYQDIVTKDDKRVYIFYGSSHWISKTTNETDVVLYENPAHDLNVNDILKGGLAVGDINNDGWQDVVVAAEYKPRVYVFFGGPSFATTDASQADLYYDFEGGASTYYNGQQVVVGDFNKDGYLEIAATDSGYNSYQGRVVVLSPTHSSSSSTITTSNTNSLLAGNATDTLGLGGVEVSVDSGSWTSCSAADGSFDSTNENYSCTLSLSLSQGSHSARVRSFNTNKIYMLSSSYATATFTYDTTPPSQASFYLESPKDNVSITDTDKPTFRFHKATDDTSGISSYQIILDRGDGKGEYTYLDNINPDPVNNNERIEENMVIKQEYLP